MAEAKKGTARVIVKKKPEEEVKAAEVQAEVKDIPKAEEKEAVKAPAKRAARTSTKRAAAEKKTASKKTGTAKRTTAKKAAVNETVNFQFGGKSYTPEELLKSCKDVWKYDLNGKDEDIKSIELYVKPDENAAYYVINGDITGSFFI